MRYIYVYIYIYILTFYITYILTQLLTLYHSVVRKILMVFSMFDCLWRQRKCCQGNSILMHKWRLCKNWTPQDSPRNRSTNSTSTDFGKSSLYLLHGISRHRASLAGFFNYCFTCINTSGESNTLSSTIL